MTKQWLSGLILLSLICFGCNGTPAAAKDDKTPSTPTASTGGKDDSGASTPEADAPTGKPEAEPSKPSQPGEPDKNSDSKPATPNQTATKPTATGGGTAPAPPAKPIPAEPGKPYVGLYKMDTDKIKAEFEKQRDAIKKKADGGDEQAKQQLQMMDAQKALITQMFDGISVTLKADNTFTIAMGPGGSMSGDYKVNGSTITFTPKKFDVKDQSKITEEQKKPQKMTYDAKSDTLQIVGEGANANRSDGMVLKKVKA